MKTIFVHNATILDCAVLIPGYGAQGRSWHVDVFWKGSVGNDGVLVDFADAKKLAKQTIDELFDHRIFVFSGNVMSRENGRIAVLNNYSKSAQAGAEDVFLLDIYPEGVVVVQQNATEIEPSAYVEMIEGLVAEAVKKASPSNVLEVTVRLRNPEEGKPNYFCYTHSLRCHGGNCQRFHGHSNIIEVFLRGRFNAEFSSRAANFLSDKYLVPAAYEKKSLSTSEDRAFRARFNGVSSRSHEHAFVEYMGTQGLVRLVVPRRVVLFTPDESTIESIADFVKSTLFVQEDVEVAAYEGLQKGALSS